MSRSSLSFLSLTISLPLLTLSLSLLSLHLSLFLPSLLSFLAFLVLKVNHSTLLYYLTAPNSTKPSLSYTPTLLPHRRCRTTTRSFSPCMSRFWAGSVSVPGCVMSTPQRSASSTPIDRTSRTTSPKMPGEYSTYMYMYL